MTNIDTETNLTSQRSEITHQHPAGGGTRGQIRVVDLPVFSEYVNLEVSFSRLIIEMLEN